MLLSIFNFIFLYVFLNEYYTGTIFFFQMDIKISLHVYILLCLFWLFLLSNCISGFIYYLFPFQKICWDWLQIYNFTPCCATNNSWWALSGPQQPINNKRQWQPLKHMWRDLLFHDTDLSLISGEKWHFQVILGSQMIWNKWVQKKFCYPSEAGSLIICTVTIVIMIYQVYLFWNSSMGDKLLWVHLSLFQALGINW